MKYVIDASVSFQWVVAERHTSQAVRLRDDFRKAIHELLVPDLWPTEIGNALLMAERRGRQAAGDGAKLLVDILNMPPSIYPALPNLLPRAYAIAATSVVSVYDCLHVALAERESCELLTDDDRLLKNLQPQFPFIRSLASLP